MLTIILRRSAEPNVIQLTQENIMRELQQVNNSEMLLEDSWTAGLMKVRTPFVCLVEADCVLSANYIASNLGIMKKTAGQGDYRGGGNMKLAMLSSCLGVKAFANRIYNYRMQKYVASKSIYKINNKTLELGSSGFEIAPSTKKLSAKPYPVQIGFVPGAIIRYASIKDVIDTINWEDKNLVRLSTLVSFHLWNTNRRVNINPNTTYVSDSDNLEIPVQFDYGRPDRVMNIFEQESLEWVTSGII